MLTAINIRDVAFGEWVRYFTWRTLPKYEPLFLLSVVLSIVFVITLMVSASATPHNVTTTQVIPSSNNIIEVNTGYYGGFVSAYQEDMLLPTLATTTDIDESATTNGILKVISLCGLVIAFMLLCLHVLRNQSMRLDFINLCEQKWIDSGFKEIPNQQSVIDFIKEK